MLQFIRKHQVLGGLLLFLVIASFVIFMIPGGDPFSAFSGGNVTGIGKIDGKPVREEELFQAQKMADLYFRVFGSGQDIPQDMVTREVYSRLILARRMDQMKIEVPTESVVERIKILFKDPTTQKFSKQFYNNFIQNALPRGLSEQDFSNLLKQELGREQLMRSLSLADSMVTPMEAKELTRREERRVKANMVVFSSTNYADQVQLNPEDLLQYYTNNMASYRTRERRSVIFVEFPATNYVDKAASSLTNLQQIVDAQYNFRKDTLKNPDGSLMDEAGARESIRSEILEEASKSLARKEAWEFTGDISPQLSSTNLTHSGKLDVLRSQALVRGLNPLSTDLFDQFGAINGVNAGPEFNSAAFRLSLADPVSMEPLESGNSYFLLGLDRIEAPVVQPFEEVKLRVESGYKREKLTEIVKNAGEEYYMSLTNSLADGTTSFEDYAAQNQYEVIDIPELTLKTGSLSNFNSVISLTSIKNTAFGLGAGEVSRFVSSGQNGFILKVQDYIPAEESIINENYTNSLATIRSQMRTGGGSFNDWMQKQLSEAGFGASE
ncbi:MAG: peptidylprolyl isomerase [Verrucomicrobia bacterium]|nr:peptidylprolyl isomerase [Verrucomicrobiota bacterium]